MENSIENLRHTLLLLLHEHRNVSKGRLLEKMY
jgi:hypothetical protein